MKGYGGRWSRELSKVENDDNQVTLSDKGLEYVQLLLIK